MDAAKKDEKQQFNDPENYRIIKAVLKPGDGKPEFREIEPPSAISTSLVLEDMYSVSYLWGSLYGYFEESEEGDRVPGALVQRPIANSTSKR